MAVGCHLGIEPEQVVAIGALLDLLELSDQAALDAQRPARKMRSTRETAKRTTFNRFAEAKTTAASLSTRIIFRNGVASWHANQAVVNGGQDPRKMANEIFRHDICRRMPHLTVDLLVAISGRVASAVNAVSRRRRGPKARVDRGCNPAILGHHGRRPAVTVRFSPPTLRGNAPPVTAVLDALKRERGCGSRCTRTSKMLRRRGNAQARAERRVCPSRITCEMYHKPSTGSRSFSCR